MVVRKHSSRFSVFLFCALISLSVSQPTYPIDWTTVSTSSSASVTVTANTELGPCVCNLRPSQCDANCCCDSECSTNVKKLFTTCLPAGPANTTINKCSSTVLASINPRDGMVVYSEPFTNLLCVEVDNNPSLGTFYSNPVEATTSLLDQEAAKTSVSNFKKSFERSPTSFDGFGASYKVNNGVASAVMFVSSLNALTRLFRLPQPDSFGQCSDQPFVGFLNSVASTPACLRKGSAIPVCESESIAYYGSQLYLASYPSSSLSTISTFIPVRVVSLQFRDSSGIITELSPISAYSTSLSADGLTCNNAVVKASYVVVYDDSGSITDATASLLLASVSTTSASSPLSFTQTFSVSFQQSADAVIKTRSGNPGYRVGSPVLSGTKSTFTDNVKTAILQKKYGIGVYGIASDGSCLTSMSSSQLNSTAPPVVTFGENLVAGCVVKLSRDELATACVADSYAYSLPILQIRDTFVGAWGNSNALNTADWVEITRSTPSSTPAWNALSGTCGGLITGVHYEFLYATFGELHNPQAKILTARVSYTTGSYSFRLASPNAKQSFPVTFTASFVRLPDRGLEVFSPPAPPTLPKLPQDIFYPFMVSPASSHSPLSFVVLLSLLLSCVLVNLVA